MTPAEARAEWVKALRSGRYAQIQKRLSGDDGMCCLGVACDVYRKSVQGAPQWAGFAYMGCRSGLPAKVMRWLGLKTTSGACGIGDSLIRRNDRGVRFPEIADLIESGKVETVDGD